MLTSEQQADVAEIRRALDLLTVPGGVFEIRALKLPGRGKPLTAAGYFLDLDKAAQAAAVLDRRKAGGVYLVLNEITPALLARSPEQTTDHLDQTTSDGDIIRRRWLPLDFDPSRPAGISSTDAEHNAAQQAAERCRDWLRHEWGWPDGILADSGNGWHVLYRVDLPADDGGLVKRCLEVIAGEFDAAAVKVDRAVFNPARIWKLYGTTARKGHSTADRPHRVARLVDVPEPVQVVTQEQLGALAGTLQKPEPTPSTSGNGHGEPFTSRLDVPRWLTDRGQGFRVKDRPDRHGRTVYVLGVCPFDGSHGSGGEVSVMQGQDGSLAAACMHNSCTGKGWQQFKEAIGRPDGNHYDPPLSDYQGNGAATAKPAAADGKGEQRKPIDYHPLTCAELIAAKFDIRFLAERILVAGQPFLVCGPQKALKTSLLVDLAFSLATAGYFLGKFRVPVAVAVGIMSAESGLATLKETIQRVARAAGVDPSTVHNLIVSDRVPQLNSLEHLDAVAEFIDRFGLAVLIIDPAFLAMDGADAGNLFIQGQLLRRISELCQAAGVTLILCHHTKKAAGMAYEPLELASIAWSGFGEFARQWLLVNRREPYTPGTGTHRLWLTVGGSVGHGGLWGVNVEEGAYTVEGGRYWQVEVLDPSEVKEAHHGAKEAEKEAARGERLQRDKQAVCNVLVKFPGGESKTVIRDLSGLHTSRFNTAFAARVADGMAVPCELFKGNRKRPFDGYKLRESNPHE
jgi:hypothetical protein